MTGNFPGRAPRGNALGSRVVTRHLLIDLLRRLDADAIAPATVYLVGETSQLYEGWRAWTPHVEMTVESASDRPELLARTVARAEGELGIRIVNESPADVIPLPRGSASRHRPVRAAAGPAWTRLRLRHFDPYSVSFRFIARGDEPDYHVVLVYMEHGWVTGDALHALLDTLLPRFTATTIQQDPAEFRRKYKGLLQMSRAVRPRTVHRATVA